MRERTTDGLAPGTSARLGRGAGDELRSRLGRLTDLGVARLFFAVCIPDEAVVAVRDLQARLRGAMGGEATGGGSMSWADAAQAHCTLKFLGEVEESRFDVLEAAGEKVRLGHGPFGLALEGLGAFPDPRRPRVLWLGVQQGQAELAALAAALDDELAGQGIAREERAFSAHLTLARIKARSAGAAVGRVLDGWPAAPIAQWRADGFSLMRSTSTPRGARYTPVFTFRLEG